MQFTEYSQHIHQIFAQKQLFHKGSETQLARGYKTFSVLNSAEHEISTVHKN